MYMMTVASYTTEITIFPLEETSEAVSVYPSKEILQVQVEFHS